MVVFPLLFVWLMWQRPSNRSVAAFAKTYAVPLTPDNAEQLRRYIMWTRRWRLAGVVAATALAVAVSMLTERGGFGWVPLVVGFSAGSLLGELLRPAERSDNIAPTASLERRRLRHFIAPHFVVWAVVVFVANLLTATYLLLDNPQRGWNGSVDPPNVAQQRPQDWFVLGLVAVSTVAVLMAWLGARALIQAPIPADTPDRLAVRVAIRTAALLALFGGTVMVSGSVGIKLGSAATMLDGDETTLVQWANNLTAMLCFVSAWWGGIMTLSTIPRLAPFSGRLPVVPTPDAHQTT
jgi:hypothetical protein